MKFGKKFSKLIAIYPEFVNLSANRCSKLSYKELKSIAKVLYPNNKELLHKYVNNSHQNLAKLVYTALGRL